MTRWIVAMVLPAVGLTRGDYTVLCNLPGHREAGMVGTLKISE